MAYRKRCGLEVNRESADDAPILQSLQPLAATWCRQPDLGRQGADGGPSVAMKPPNEVAVDVVEEQFCGSQKFHTADLTAKE